jgi:MSHA biogenesis protein MshL
MRIALPAGVLMAALAGCAAPPPPAGVNPEIAAVLANTAQRVPESRPEAIDRALLPPLKLDMPGPSAAAVEPRFDLSVSNAPATQVFMSIVSGTRYSMLVHPSVSGTISVNLKDVTVQDALAALRDLYGYEYRVEGSRIFIQATGLQTRVFQVNYLPGQRRGSSVLRVTSGSLTDAGSPGAGGMIGGAVAPGASAAGAVQGRESTRVSTDQQATFWFDLCEALVAIAFPADAAGQPAAVALQSGPAEDRQRSICNRRHAASERSIVVTPHSGVIVVRATGAELRSVENYLKATRIAVERQVMLEAKIIEVTLSDAFQSGINWTAFRNSGPNIAVGQVASQTTLGARGQTLSAGGLAVDTSGRGVSAGVVATGIAANNPAAAVFGLALQTSNFAALLQFLESQGNVQVLSSPRIATLNNQKAVLKVGSDELFVSNIAVTPATSTVGGTTQPTIAPQFAPYFSGIVLDVTPQIDENGNITLHVHPSISEVTQVNRQMDFGAGTGPTNVPTARSQVSETDTIVRVSDGNIVAIGGLMSVDVRDNRGGIPGLSDEGLGRFLRNTDRQVVKKELVILLKPTLVQSDKEWEQDLRETRGRVDSMSAPRTARPQ